MSSESYFYEFIDSVKSNFHPLKLFLFGSRAWGSPDKNSDYDVLILAEDGPKKSNQLAAEILLKCHPGKISLDLVVKSNKEIQDRLKIRDPFYTKIVEEGTLIYERNI